MKKVKIKLLYVGDYWYNTNGNKCQVYTTKKDMQLSGKIRIYTSGTTYTYTVARILKCINEEMYTGFTRNNVTLRKVRANMLLANAVSLCYHNDGHYVWNEVASTNANRITIDNSINNSITINTTNNEETGKIITNSGSKEIPTAIKSNSTRRITIASPLIGDSIQSKCPRTEFREFKILKVSISC